MEWHQARERAAESPAAQRDRRLSAAFLEAFSTPAGRMVLDHLRSELVQSIMAPDTSEAALRYREGQRSVVGIIDYRMREARGV